MAEARAVLRNLIRTVDRHITYVTGNALWREEVVAEFRKHSGESDPVRQSELLQHARNYAFLLRSVREHKELLLSYNIGIERDSSKQQVLYRSARSVGLELPKQEDD